VAITPDGRRAVSGSWDKTLRVWDLQTGQSIRTLEGHTNWVWAVAIAPDGLRAVSGSVDKTLRLWDLQTGRQIAEFTTEAEVWACCLSPDGEVFVAGDGAGRVHVLRLMGGGMD